MLHSTPFSSYTVLASKSKRGLGTPDTLGVQPPFIRMRGFFVRCHFMSETCGHLHGGRVLMCGSSNPQRLAHPIGTGSETPSNHIRSLAMHECIAHCPVCGRKFPIPVLGNLDQKVEIRCVCGHTFRVSIEELAVSQKLVSPAPVQKVSKETTMNALQNYQFESNNVRIVVEKGEPLFCASDVCKALGYANTPDALKKHCSEDGIAKRDTIDSLGRNQSTSFINEKNLYRLVMRSKLPSAEKFQDWVCGEVLPSIRKTGKYAVAQQQFAIPQTLPEALRLAADLADKNAALESKVKADAPKVEFCDKVVADNEAMTITKAAKVIGYPPRKLKDYIRQIGWLYANSDTPMQSTITSGYMVLRFAHWTDVNGNAVEKPYAHITNKGLFALYRRMRREDLIEKNEQLELAA